MIRRFLRGCLWAIWGLIWYVIAHALAPRIGPPVAVMLWVGAMAIPRYWPLITQQVREALRRNW